MEITKVRGIAGRAEEKARHLALKDTAAVSRADPNERRKHKSLWRLRAPEGPYKGSPVREFVCVNKNSKQLNSKQGDETWFEYVMAWWTKIKEHNVKGLQRCHSLPWPWPSFVYARWAVSSTTKGVQIQRAAPLWKSSSEVTIWYIQNYYPTGPLRVISLVSPKAVCE